MIPVKRAKLGEKLPIDYKKDIYFSECHNHDYFEFMCTIRGRGINVINDTIQFFEPRCLMLIRPEDIHFVKKIDEFESTFEYFNIPIPKEFIEKEFAECKALEKFVMEPDIPHRVKISNTEIGVLIAKVLMLKEMGVSEERKYLYFKLAHEMIGALLTGTVIPEEKLSEWFSDLLVKIENIRIEDLNFDAVLAMANVARQTLWKAFKKYLSVSPVDYIAIRRAEAAYNMVVNSDKPLTDIAMEMNYGSYVQFYREIKKWYGSSPNELRKNK